MDYPDNHRCHPHQRPSDLIGAADVAVDSEVLPEYECFVGVSPYIAALKRFVRLQAAMTTPVLLIGERGLRQEQIAHTLHQASPRGEQPFLHVSTRSLSDHALDELLSGPRGAIESLEYGAIYIDDLVGLPMLAQQRLAVCIEEQRWRERSSLPSKPRLIFATEDCGVKLNSGNRLAIGLIEQLRQSSFRLKPLRERGEDVPYLARYLAARIAKRLNKSDHEITPEAMDSLMEYLWKQNIDEMEAVLESAIANAPPPRIDETMLPDRVRYAALRVIPPDGLDLPRIVDDYERSIIEMALRQTRGSQTKAAQLLGLRVQTLNMKLKRFNSQQVES